METTKTSEILNLINNKTESIKFKDEQAFVQACEQLERATERIQIPVAALTAKAKGEEYSADKKSITEKISIDYGVGESNIKPGAVKSLCDRAGISGTALSKVSTKELCQILNCCLSVNDRSTTAVKYGDEYAAFLSENYKVLPLDEIAEITANKVKELGGSFVSGAMSLEGIIANYKMPQNIAAAYKKLTNDALFKTEVTPILSVISSNVGLSGANIYPAFKTARTVFTISKPITLDHKGNASIEKFKEHMDQIYALFNKAITGLESLKKVRLEYPRYTFLNACKKVGVGKKLTFLAYQEFQDMLEDVNTCTAYDVFMGMTEILYFADSKGQNSKELFELQEVIARAFSIKWADIDYPKSDWE